MNAVSIKKVSALLLSIALIAAMLLMLGGCADEVNQASKDKTTIVKDGDVVGEGSRMFYFTIVGADGTEVSVEVHTDETIVGKALMALDLIGGEDSDYGLYVKTVNGTTLSYEEDGKYWAFYIGEEYASSGVDSTQIVDGEHYIFKAE